LGHKKTSFSEERDRHPSRLFFISRMVCMMRMHHNADLEIGRKVAQQPPANRTSLGSDDQTSLGSDVVQGRVHSQGNRQTSLLRPTFRNRNRAWSNEPTRANLHPRLHLLSLFAPVPCPCSGNAVVRDRAGRGLV